MDCPKCHAPSPDAQAYCARCGASLQASAPAGDASGDTPTGNSFQARDELESGATFAGRYQVIEELGRGGMGRVYKVLDKELRAKIALKLIRPEIAADPAAIDRFRQELTTARGISHNNICRMFDLGRDGETYYLTMEYVSGQDLKSMIAMSGQLGVGTAISIAKQVCDGLGEAHRHGVIHRDLKPQNIQIDRGGHAKIMDFGIARSGPAKGLTGAGVVVGTPQYMSPEQVEARAVDARSDLYSLGIILYEMLTGRVPFDGDTPLSVAMKQKLERPRDPRQLNPAVTADLGGVILKCLDKDAERRYQTADELRADLVRIEQGLPTAEQVVPQQRPSTSREVTVHFTMRQLLVPALAVVAVLAVSVGAWRLLPRKAAVTVPAHGKPTLAVLYFENISGDASLNAWRTGLPELLTTGLSQSRLLNVVSSDNVFSILKKLNLADATRYSAEDLAAVASEGRVQYLLTGSIMKAGQSTVITTRLRNAATGDLIRSSTLECLKEEEIVSKVNGLTGEIKADLNLSPQDVAGDAGQPLGQVLTSSPEALKYYTEARRFHLNNESADAIRLYERAIEADPNFAMAYRGMAAAYSNIGDSERQAAAARKALDLSDRLPERLRYQVQSTAYAAAGDYLRSIEACNKLLAKYPDDFYALVRLGIVYLETEEFDKAAGVFATAMQVSPSALSADNVASAERYLGHYEQAAAALGSYLDRDPANARAHFLLGGSYLAAGQIEAAQREVEKASLLAPSDPWVGLYRGGLSHLRGDFAAAERELSSILARAGEPDRQSARAGLVNVFAAQGRFDKARELAKALPPEWARTASLEWDAGRPERAITAFRDALARPALASRPLVVMVFTTGLGLSYAATGDAGKARQAAVDVEAKGGTLFARPAARWKLAISGTIAARRGDWRAAVDDLERAVARLPFQSSPDEEHALVLDLLAQAYVAAGDLAKARQTYERITGLTTGRSMWGGIYARSYYHLGRIAERQGDTAGARAGFGKFLELWKNADPGLPEVADARTRLGR